MAVKKRRKINIRLLEDQRDVEDVPLIPFARVVSCASTESSSAYLPRSTDEPRRELVARYLLSGGAFCDRCLLSLGTTWSGQRRTREEETSCEFPR